MSKVLCIVPLYNKIQFLDFTIASIMVQEDVQVELVIVDDCSTDGSYEWCTEKLSDYPYVHILRNEENVGCYQSRNRGLKYAIDNNIDFDYYVVTDPDDQQIKDRFKKVIQGFIDHPHYVVMKQPYYRYNIDTKEMVEKSDAGEGAAMFKREVFDKIGYWDNSMRFSGDTEYIIRLAHWFDKNGLPVDDKIGIYNEPLLWALTDNSGQNLTTLHPTFSPERQATFDYINYFASNVTSSKQCYYDFTNKGHTYTSMGPVAFRN